MNNQETKDNMTNSEVLLFCSKCHTIPLISILSTNPATVKIYCPCEKRIIDINTYLEEINHNKELLISKHCLNELHNNISSSTFCSNCDEYICNSCYVNHNTEHQNSTMKNEGQIVKEHEHSSELGFCFNCFKNTCFKCTNEHDEHMIMYFAQVLNLSSKERQNDYNKVINGYKKILLETKDNCINELLNTINRINNSVSECIQRNESILKLIGIIIDNYLVFPKEELNYQTRINLISNTDFTINDKIYKKLPYFRNSEDVITFFQSFSVIKENHVYDFNEKNKAETIIKFNTKYYICSFLIHSDNKHIILGKNNGDMGIYNMERNIYSYKFFPAHSKKIRKIISLSYNKFATYSRDSVLKIWKLKEINGKLCSLLDSTYLGDNGSIYSAAPLSNNRIAFTTSEGNLFIYSTCYLYNLIYSGPITNDITYKKIIPKGFYHSTLVVISNFEIMFYKVINDKVKKEEKSLINIKTHQFETAIKTKKEKIIILGKIDSTDNVYLVIIDIHTKSIETICKYYPCNPGTIKLFVQENKKGILYRTSLNNILFIDKTNFLILRIPIFTKNCIIYYTQLLSNNIIVGLKNNNSIVMTKL